MLRLSALAWILSLCACATVPPASADAPPEYDAVSAYPHWAGRPVSWAKLEEIETWLAGRGPEQYPEYVDQAELELAEGRLALARKEGSASSSPVLAGRLRAAESGFRGLLRKPGLEPTVKRRAEKGLEEIDSLRGRPVAAAPRAAAARSSNAIPGNLSIQLRSAWNAASPVASRLTTNASPWSRITIHHSAKYSKEMGVPSNANVAGTIRDIQTVHMRDEGYGDIGYHFLIDPAGRIWQGRTLDWQGAHAGGANGANNVGNIGICLLGDFNTEKPDPRALESLEKLVDALCERHRIARSRIYGHRQLRSTECPGDALMAWVSHYAAGATH